MSIIVSATAFAHTDDVDPDKHIDANQIDKAMSTAVDHAVNALENPTGNYTDLQRANIQTSLRSARTTHSTVRTALSWGDENPMSVDALALARIPLESLYNICLFTESPNWVDAYLRDGWKKQYVHFLLQREETKNLKRFKNYASTGLTSLAEMGQFIGITSEEVATIEHEQLGTPLPNSMQRTSIQSFPTPGRALVKLPVGSDKRRMLERLHYEYVYLCSFVHNLPEANFFKMTFNSESKFRNLWSNAALASAFRKEVANRAYEASLLGVIQATAEVAALYPGCVDLMAAVTAAWQEMSSDSLLGRAVWHIRTKSLLGILDEPPPATARTATT